MGHKLPSRTRARSRAVDVLYEVHLKDSDDLAGIYSLAKLRGTETTAQTPMPPYACEILEGVAEHLSRIDAALATYSRAWSLHRMPEMDLATMRMATWEILFNPDMGGPVAITTVTQLVAERPIDESPKSINGLLGTINDMREALVAQYTPKTDSDANAEIPEPAGTPVDSDMVAKVVWDYAHQEGEALSQIDLENLE